MMSNDQLLEFLKGLAPDAELSMGKQYVEALVPAAKLHDVAHALKHNTQSSFDYMICLSGVDYADHIQIVYHLESTTHRHAMVLKVKTGGRDNPAIDSVYDIWAGAEFHEREVFDLLGVSFNNHPDLRRLFLEDNWGYPLRKDYVDDVHIVSR
jgi:NADH-quinone oxidoreductase subunit C